MSWLLLQNVTLVLILTVVAILVQAWLSLRLGHKKLRDNHEVAGFVYAVVGSIFAVNMALALDTVHDEFVNGGRAAMQEAIQLEGIYRMTGMMEPDQGSRIRGAVIEYTRAVVEKEWGDWNKATPGVFETNAAYARLWEELTRIESKTNGQQLAHSEMLSRANNVDISRQSRLYSGTQKPPLGIRVLQWLGGVITVGFGLFFTMENRRAHLLMLVSVSLLVWGNLALLDTIRFPFNGFYFMEPTPYLQFLGRVVQ